MNQFQSGIWAGALGGSLVLDTPIARYYAADCVVESGKVVMWPPRFGNVLNVLSTPDPTKRVGWSATSDIGKPVVTLDGTQGIGCDPFYLPVGVTDIVVLVVSKLTVYAGSTVVTLRQPGASPDPNGGMSLSYGTVFGCQTFGNVGINRQRILSGGSSFQPNKWMRLGGMGYLSDPNPESTSFLNGVMGTVNTSFDADNTSYFSSMGRLFVGNYSYSSSFMTGLISEIHIYPRLTTPDFLELDAQVAATYPPFP